jgi:hypothetical protein
MILQLGLFQIHVTIFRTLVFTIRQENNQTADN